MWREKIGNHEYLSDKCIYCGAKKEKTYLYLDSDDDDFWYAVSAAQELVKEKLKSPSTAKFPLNDYTVKRYSDEYVVIGYVDAQNSLGTTVRSYWSTSFTMGGASGGKYKISNYEVSFY